MYVGRASAAPSAAELNNLTGQTCGRNKGWTAQRGVFGPFKLDDLLALLLEDFHEPPFVIFVVLTAGHIICFQHLRETNGRRFDFQSLAEVGAAHIRLGANRRIWSSPRLSVLPGRTSTGKILAVA